MLNKDFNFYNLKIKHLKLNSFLLKILNYIRVPKQIIIF